MAARPAFGAASNIAPSLRQTPALFSVSSAPRQVLPMSESHVTTAPSQPARAPTTRGTAPSALTFIHPASPLTAAKVATNRAEDFDALADLFLSELPLVCTPAKVSVARRDCLSSEESRPSEKPSTPRASPAAAGPTDHDTPHPLKSSQSARIEAVLLGHLPVYAAAWIGQYARLRAAQLGGPVALLRVTGQWVRVELTGLAPEAATRFVETGDLMAALATATGASRNEAAALSVLLCATASDEHRLVSMPAVQDITLLTGADEASTVAAYRVIKSIAHNIAANANLSGTSQVITIASECRPGFRLVVAGCDQPTATTIWRRLADAARTFLGLELDLAGFMPQVNGSQPSTLLYDGPLTDSIEKLLEMVQSCQRPIAIMAAPESAPLNTRGASARSTSLLHDTKFESNSTPESEQTADVVDDFFDAEADEADRIETARAVEALASFAARTGRAVPAASTQQPSLTQAAVGTTTITEATSKPAIGPSPVKPEAATSPAWFLALGLTSLGLRCPVAPAAHIGHCGSGRLHVAALGGLTQAEHESAIVSLLRAGVWCCEHCDMLCHLMGDGLIKETASIGKPVLHLISSSGPLARQSCIAGIDVSLLASVPPGATCVAVSLTRSH